MSTGPMLLRRISGQSDSNKIRLLQQITTLKEDEIKVNARISDNNKKKVRNTKTKRGGGGGREKIKQNFLSLWKPLFGNQCVRRGRRKNGLNQN